MRKILARLPVESGSRFNDCEPPRVSILGPSDSEKESYKGPMLLIELPDGSEWRVRLASIDDPPVPGEAVMDVIDANGRVILRYRQGTPEQQRAKARIERLMATDPTLKLQLQFKG